MAGSNFCAAKILTKSETGVSAPKNPAGSLRMSSLVLLLLLGMASSTSLSPGRIGHPMAGWVNNPIELSENNAGATGVSITISFSTTTAITAGYLAITIPTAFTTTGATVTGTGSVSNSVAAWTAFTSSSTGDNTVVINGVTNPTVSAGYGPFSIVTRHYSLGQIVDANYVYGSVGIAPAHGTISNFGVKYLTTTDNLINKSGVELEFSFTIGTDLWKHDLFAIRFDPHF